MSHKLKAFLGTLSVIALMALGAPAHARLVGSGFDPTLFDGYGHFFVPDPPGSPCVTLSAGFHFVNPGFQGCNGVVLEDVLVNIDDGLGDTAQLSLPSPSDLIFGMVLDPTANSIVVGIDSFLIPLSVGDCTYGPDDLCNYDWFIEWVSLVKPTHSNPLNGLFNEVILYRSCSDEEENIHTNGLSSDGGGYCKPVPFGEPAAHVTFTPEPGSLALLGSALAAGWLVRRRKGGR